MHTHWLSSLTNVNWSTFPECFCQPCKFMTGKTGLAEALHNWSGPKLDPEYYSIKFVGGRQLTTANILFLSVVLSLIGLKITMPLCLLLSSLHNRIPCMHNAWEADSFTPLDILFLSIIA